MDNQRARKMSDLMGKIDDAIESTMIRHEALCYSSVCTCGVRNNMDGDVLFSHRVGMVSQAVRAVLENHQ